MTRWTKLISIAVIVVLGLTLVGASAVYAQGGGATAQQQAQQAGRGKLLRAVMNAVLDAAATVTNVDKATLLKEMSTGKSLADVVKAHGGDISAIETAAKGPITTSIQQAVTDGTLTQAQADKLTANLDKVLDKLVNRTPPTAADRRVNLLKAVAVGILVKETAAETKLAPRDLLKELRSGKTLSDIAAAQNVDPNGIVTAAAKTITDRVNKLVSSGKLTQAQADKLTTNLQANLTTLMNTPNPLKGSATAAGGNRGASGPAPSQTSPSGPVPEGTPAL